jgi:hypothetical protein
MRARLPPQNPPPLGANRQKTLLGRTDLLHGTDRQLRVNVNQVVDTFVPTPDRSNTRPGSSTGAQTNKRKRLEGTEWSQVTYTAVLGMRPRDFILQLASYCLTLDIQQAIRDVVSVHPSPANTGTLVSLTTEHALHTHNSNMAKFWQSVIEVQIALRCERLVLFVAIFLGIFV